MNFFRGSSARLARTGGNLYHVTLMVSATAALTVVCALWVLSFW